MPVETAAAKSDFSASTGYRIRREPRLPTEKVTPQGRRRPDPHADLFENEVVALLNLAHVNADLTELTTDQAEDIGADQKGPFKSDKYRYLYKQFWVVTSSERSVIFDIYAAFLFVISAVGLLGSPGPAIACLLAVGRAETVLVGLRYLTGMLIGLATAAAACAAGIVSAREALPSLFTVLSIVAGIYLVYLAYKIATAPVGAVRAERRLPSTFWAGLMVGLSNPKAYVAFISLFASHILFHANEFADNLVKWVLTVAVMIAVDTAWLFVGVSLKKANFNEQFERVMNYTLGAMVLVTTFLALAV